MVQQVCKVSLKQTVKALLRNLGYEIKRLPSKPEKPAIPSRPDGCERNSAEYDLIWSDTQFIKGYQSEMRRRFCYALLDLVDRSHLFSGIRLVADVGCGPGLLLKMISERYANVKLVGLDFSPRVFNFAREECKDVEFRQHDIYNTLEEKFDLLFCTEVIEHLLHPVKAVENILAAANKIVLTIPNGRIDTYDGHINFWSIESWQVFLQSWESEWRSQTQYLFDDRYIVTVMAKSHDGIGWDGEKKEEH